jgi:HlyD family secretion protein
MKYFRLTLVVVLVAVGAGLFYSQRNGDAAVVEYNTVTVERGTLTATVSATGTLNPLTTVLVGSQVSGRIDKIFVDFNSIVKEGEAIAQIDPSIFKTQVAREAANLNSAIAELEKADVKVRETRRQVQRLTELRSRNLVAESELDSARFAYDAALAERRVREAAVAQAQAALEQARVNLEQTTIYAPIDGVVVARSVDVGQTVAASLQAPTLFSIAKDLTEMQIETQVDEAFIGQIRERQPVAFTVFAYPGQHFSGVVEQVRLNPTVESGVVTYNCIIRVANPELLLKPGMTATVSIEVKRREDVLIVPSSALRFVPQWPADKLAALRSKLQRDQAVLWAADDEDIKPLTVTLGLVGEKQTEVRGEDVRAGMTVAISGGAAKKASGPRGLRLF